MNTPLMTNNLLTNLNNPPPSLKELRKKSYLLHIYIRCIMNYTYKSYTRVINMLFNIKYINDSDYFNQIKMNVLNNIYLKNNLRNNYKKRCDEYNVILSWIPSLFTTQNSNLTI